MATDKKKTFLSDSIMKDNINRKIFSYFNLKFTGFNKGFKIWLQCLAVFLTRLAMKK